MSAPSITAVRMTKSYGRVNALQDITLELGPGIHGLLGPNGSGKSTLMGLVAGLLRPSHGELRVCGRAPFGDRETLARIGVCPEADALPGELSAREFVTSMARLSGLKAHAAAEAATASLRALGLDDAMDRPMREYSRGMRQRAKLAQAIVHEPDVLLLDEPLTGTDPTSRATILTELRRHASRGALVVVSSHVLHEIEALTDELVLVARGRIVAVGKVHDIRAMLDDHPHTLRVVCRAPRALAAALAGSDDIGGLRFVDDTTLEVDSFRPDVTYGVVARALTTGDFGLRAITSPDATVEALFHWLVERGNRGAGTGLDAGVGRAGGGSSR